MLFRRKTEPADTDSRPGGEDSNVACAWCGRQRAELAALVSDGKVAICNDCLAFAIATMDRGERDRRPRFAVAQQVLERSLEELGPDPSPDDVEALLTAALALNGDDLDGRRRLAQLAFGAGATARGREILGSIPAVFRNHEDLTFVAWTHLREGDFAAALAVLEEPAEGQPPEVVAGLMRVYRIAGRLGPEHSLPPSEIDEMIRSLAEARVMCGEQNRTVVEAVLADCHLRRGDVRSAHTIIRNLAGTDADDGGLQLLLGDVLSAKGETAPAREAWQKAASHPRTTPLTIARARERLARGSAPYR